MAKKILSYQLKIHEDLELPCKGFLAEIENTLEAKQDFVGGTIQCIHLTDEIDMICNEDGKLLELPFNRLWIYEGKPIDIIVGNILCVRHEGDEFTSILESDKEIIEEHLKPVLNFFGNLLVIPESELESYKNV